ncbi:nucleotide sugar dehydrogenase [Alicyclobacillus contaminans]|uniref:nucleotide sugar dehydrogenase n=1 Tax=Alicyclobacillus contaminans TaxID=392016 RepID=UPI0004195F04|nr:nucleotide sugar dehydrogenase [Alicyclobacillus contaminans]
MAMEAREPSTGPQHVCIVGLGYVGLPLAIEFWKQGLRVTGIDVDRRKISLLKSGKSYLTDVEDASMAALAQSERFDSSTAFDAVAQADAIILCVPTPLDDQGHPDLRFVLGAAHSISQHLQQGQLVVLESSTFPGTTEDHLRPVLEQSGWSAGTDFSLAYSPERINPGSRYDMRDIPKVVGGIDHLSLERASALYAHVFRRIVPVSSPRVAELTKLVENTQRFINISAMNELAVLCHKWGIDLWEAIDAAATKPYGFTPYYPSPGAGGHCIPVDPLYLDWFSTLQGDPVRFIQLARAVNDRMPTYVADRILRMCASPHPRVLLLGVTYKPDVNDVRESAGLKVFAELLDRQAAVSYFDPYVPLVRVNGQDIASLPDLIPEQIASFDVVALLVGHRVVNYERILAHARAILDTQNLFRHHRAAKVTPL